MCEPIKSLNIDNLNVLIFRDRGALGHVAAAKVANKMREILREKDRIRMVFAAAPSQNEFLEELGALKGIDWDRVVVFHMDEYVGLHPDDPRSFGTFLKSRLFLRVEPGETHFIDTIHGVDEGCISYSERILQAPIDIVCLGIGENGHIAFNDPSVADFNDPQMIKLVNLEYDCRIQQVHDGCFPSLESVPKTAVTLTIPTLISGHHLFCMVSGSNKRTAVRRTLHGPVSPECPASILRFHPDCTLFVDLDSYWEIADDCES